MALDESSDIVWRFAEVPAEGLRLSERTLSQCRDEAKTTTAVTSALYTHGVPSAGFHSAPNLEIDFVNKMQDQRISRATRHNESTTWSRGHDTHDTMINRIGHHDRDPRAAEQRGTSRRFHVLLSRLDKSSRSVRRCKSSGWSGQP